MDDTLLDRLETALNELNGTPPDRKPFADVDKDVSRSSSTQLSAPRGASHCGEAAGFRTPRLQGCRRNVQGGEVLRCAQLGCGRAAHYLGQVAAYAFGFTAHLGGDAPALGDETAENGGFLEHGRDY
ncbi:hypothetical protein ACFYWX_40445 [Streptomyces sp. NPDC002888]|uniref:hypothetical protein n=1 Tax=Streptomyces sp. NPDC002888 TaxID=3364668 RepID=UPI0036BA8975